MHGMGQSERSGIVAGAVGRSDESAAADTQSEAAAQTKTEAETETEAETKAKAETQAEAEEAEARTEEVAPVGRALDAACDQGFQLEGIAGGPGKSC